MFDWYWRRVRAAAGAEVAVLLLDSEARMASRIEDLRAESERANVLMTARWISVDRRLDGLLARADGVIERLRRLESAGVDIHERLAVGFDRLHEASGEVADRIDSQGRHAIERVFDSPVTYWGGQLSMWMASPAGEAVRYAVRKNVVDPSLTDGDLMRREALQWSKAWLREHEHAIPPDAQLGFMIEAAVLESKTSVVADGR